MIDLKNGSRAYPQQSGWKLQKRSKDLDGGQNLLRIEQIFHALNDASVDYLLVGGLASVLYGVPRTTVDIDISIRPKEDHIFKAIEALESLGLVPDTSVPDEILGQGGVTFSNEREIDMITDLKGIDFNTAWDRRKQIEYEGITVQVISREDLITALKAVGRQKDLDDLKDLE